VVTALRGFFRYLRHRGEIDTNLAGCVPRVPDYSFSTVPKFLPGGSVEKILRRTDRSTPRGRRDYAILMLLARLGLRTCEVFRLELEDIDWESGQITIRDKGGRWSKLPLPPDVGEALAVYLQHDALSAGIQRVLAIPPKRQSSRLVDFLTRPEIEALVVAPDQTTWLGRRDRGLLLFAIQTGLRVSELIGLRQGDIYLGRGAHVRCEGKGRKQRCTPLTRTTVQALRAWVREQGRDETKFLFPSTLGGQLSHDSVQYLVAKYATSAAISCRRCERSG